MTQARAASHLVQLLLPLHDASGHAFPSSHYSALRAELTERFGGLTAYSRAPAEGLWTDDESPPERDDIVVYEVMVDALDRTWWAALRERLRVQLQQDDLVVRAIPMERL